MSFSDETLMAYADGELEPAEREQIERAMRDDLDLAARVERHRALRMDVFAAFAPVLDEPMPARLTAAALPDKVASLDAVRGRAAVAPAAPRRAWSWREWGGMAASLLVGLLAGNLLTGDGQSPTTVATVASADGALAATGALAEALSSQLAVSQPSGADIKIGVSFVARDGALCRSFIAGTAAGLACRSGGQWTLPVVTEVEQQGGGQYRQAGGAMPAAVMDAIDARIAGPALDAEGERAARQEGWARRGK